MKLVCKNELGGIYIDAAKAGLLLEVNGKKSSLRICEFLLLRQRVNDIDWEGILLDTNTDDDFHQFSFTIRSKSTIYDLTETLRLRDLLNTAHFYFSLKDVLTRSGVSMEYNLNIPSEEELAVY
ncbi:hypothetical protein C3K47_10380 [Solitalea longa]|uniref:Uncharacterized protein n=1 Tax=Solitalea longa TaxID=2079460 RepID=A0A2S5A2I7_9SPHI|nr:hypothetical protein [Solitalea longa]POY36755.1 hypothetical protein C3K47_10380 [Solitalea longa]